MTKRLFMIAGAALSVGTFAQAQTLDQSRSYSSELLSDASTRTSSLAPAAQDFTPAVHGYEQFRFDWNQRDSQPGGVPGNIAGKDNKETIGFQNARTRLNVSGNIASENWGYFIQFGFGDLQQADSSDPESSLSGTGGAFLEDAYGWYNAGNGWSFKWGQFKLPLFREELVGDTYQLFIDRSVADTFFTQQRSQGIQASYEGDQFRFAGAFSDGLRTANTDFTSGTEADWALTGRGEFKWAGDWKQAKDFTSFQNSEFFGMVGGAVHYQKGGSTVATADLEDFAATADVSVEGNGWNVFGAIDYNRLKPKGSPSLSDFAILVQGGIFVAADWELVAGWDILIPDSNHGPNSNGDATDKKFNTLRLGVNHYIVPESHAAKISVNLSYFVDKQDTSAMAIPNTATGLLSSDKKGQWNLGGQVQLVF